MVPSALQTYTSDAYNTANQRIEKLEANVLPKINQIDGMLPAFADPAFQILLRKAQQTAAATEREDDYSLLTELLVCHVQKGNDRKNRAGISQAIEIVDQIDNDALCALTVAHAVSHYLPVSGDFNTGLEVLNTLFSQLMYQELPSDVAWIDHLDILGAARFTMVGKLKTFSEYYSSRLDGYVCVGIKENSDEYNKAIEILKNAQINCEILVANECLEGFVRLKLTSKSSIEQLGYFKGLTRVAIDDRQQDALRQVWDLYCQDPDLKNKAKTNFMTLWDSYTALHDLRIWWENTPQGFQITRVGEILAHTNAKRCSSEIPDLI